MKCLRWLLGEMGKMGTAVDIRCTGDVAAVISTEGKHIGFQCPLCLQTYGLEVCASCQQDFAKRSTTVENCDSCRKYKPDMKRTRTEKRRVA